MCLYTDMTQVGMATSKQTSAYIGYFSLEPFVWWVIVELLIFEQAVVILQQIPSGVMPGNIWSCHEVNDPPPKTDLPDRKRQDGLAVKYPLMMLTLKTQISKLDSTMTELDLELRRLIRGPLSV